MRATGIILCILGVLGILGSLSMDTTVRVPSMNTGTYYLDNQDQYVHNTGLMQQQTMYLIVSCLLAFVGVILIVFDALRPKPWQCDGIFRENGEDTSIVVSAHNKEEAIQIANGQGVMVGNAVVLESRSNLNPSLNEPWGKRIASLFWIPVVIIGFSIAFTGVIETVIFFVICFVAGFLIKQLWLNKSSTVQSAKDSAAQSPTSSA